MMLGFDQLWSELEPIGRFGGTGGYRRFAYEPEELACREWFTATARARGLDVEIDRNGNLWAWWVPPGVPGDAPALVIGSHLDSVPDGGPFDGPLGIVSSFVALDVARSIAFVPKRPIAVVAFADEEGARFGIACAGSRLMTGQLDPAKARSLVGRDGASMAEAMVFAGHDPSGLGRDDERLAKIGAFVELHVEQGRALIYEDAAVGVASSIWPHGRYRFTFRGVSDHAGTTRMTDRHDPMSTFAVSALNAYSYAARTDSRATFGRMEVEPNGTNAIPSIVRAWLDARAKDSATLEDLVATVTESAVAQAANDGTAVDVSPESVTGELSFDPALRDQLVDTVAKAFDRPTVPVLPTGAGHDAGILAAAGVPTAMLFVRNPTGISHSPSEFAEPSDCYAGVEALVAVVRALA